MKKIYFGLFLAISALPAALITGVFSFRYVLGGGLPTALDVAAKTAAIILGLALFVLMGGLVSKIDAAQKSPAGEGWAQNAE